MQGDKPDAETINLVVDLTVALEGLLFPDLADTSIDPAAVNARALAWIDRFAMDAAAAAAPS